MAYALRVSNNIQMESIFQNLSFDEIRAISNPTVQRQELLAYFARLLYNKANLSWPWPQMLIAEFGLTQEEITEAKMVAQVPDYRPDTKLFPLKTMKRL